MLPGFMGNVMMAGGDLGLVLRGVRVGNPGSGVGLALPSGSRAGDLAVYIQLSSNGSVTAPGAGIPTGFTIFRTQTAGVNPNLRLTISFKVLDAGDLSGNIIGEVFTSFTRQQLWVYTANRAIDQAFQNFSQSANNGNTQTIPADSTPDTLIYIAAGAAHHATAEYPPVLNGTLISSGAEVTPSSNRMEVAAQIQPYAKTSRTVGIAASSATTRMLISGRIRVI